MVTVSCEDSDPAAGFGEDRQISGIYEAEDARWRPIRDAADGPYLAAAKRQHVPGTPGLERWLKTDPTRGPDFLAGYQSRATGQLRSLVTGEVGCGGIDIPLVEGRALSSNDDPCDLLRHEQAAYSDGKTRLGWPFVVIDSSGGRNVYRSDPATALRRTVRVFRFIFFSL